MYRSVYITILICPILTRLKYGYLDMNKVNKSPSDEPYSSEDLDSIPGGYQLLSQPRKLFTVDFQDKRQVELLVVQGIYKSLDFKVKQYIGLESFNSKGVIFLLSMKN